jgi:hypothetical protein
MAPFDELQALWQSQPVKTIPHFDAAAAAGAFRRYGRRQDVINTVKVILLLAAIVNAIFFGQHRPVVLFAVSLMLLCGFVALVAEWRNQRAIASFDFSAPSVAFVRGALDRLQAQRNALHTREYAAVFVAVFVGYNAIVISSYGRSTIAERVIGHAMGAILPVMIYVVGRAVRAHRWEAECRPLVDRLSALLETLEERAR